MMEVAAKITDDGKVTEVGLHLEVDANSIDSIINGK